MPWRCIAQTWSGIRHSLRIYRSAAIHAQKTIKEWLTSETRPFRNNVSSGRIEPRQGKRINVVLFGEWPQLAFRDHKRTIFAFIGKSSFTGSAGINRATNGNSCDRHSCCSGSVNDSFKHLPAHNHNLMRNRAVLYHRIPLK